MSRWAASWCVRMSSRLPIQALRAPITPVSLTLPRSRSAGADRRAARAFPRPLRSCTLDGLRGKRAPRETGVGRRMNAGRLATRFVNGRIGRATSPTRAEGWGLAIVPSADSDLDLVPDGCALRLPNLDGQPVRAGPEISGREVEEYPSDRIGAR